MVTPGVRGAALMAVAVATTACTLSGGSRDCGQLSAPVTIQRDEWGVPHVRARTLADAAFGQGYAQAEDRLLQIDLLRRTAKGARAELLGEAELEMDRLVRTLGLVQAAEAALAALDEQSLCWVDAYAGGVNRYLDDMRAGVDGVARPADLDALDPDYVPPPWTRLDVVIVATAATFSLSSNLVSDLVLTASRLLLGESLYDKLVHFAPLVNAYTLTDPAEDEGIQPLTSPARGASGKPVAVAEQTGFAPQSAADVAAALAKFAGVAHALRDNLGPYSSNNWAVASGKTSRGFAFLASDPHGGVGIPSSFHEAHLLVEEPPLNAYGIAVAGAPMIHIGHNGRAAWAFTNYGADVGDLYEEVVDPADHNAVLRDGASIPIETREETILVRPEGGSVAAAEAEFLTVRVVPGHGPVLTQVLPDPLPVIFNGKLLTYRWVGYGGTREARALAGLITVTDWESYLVNASYWDVGAQNTVYANEAGQVGYYATGLFPARPWIGEGLSPIEPLPGDGAAEWQGFDDFSHLREMFQPEWGFVASANGDPAGLTADDDPLTPEYLGYVYDMGFRTHRIKTTLVATDEHDLAGMEALQTDVRVGLGEMLTPRLLLAAAREATAVAAAGLADLVGELGRWDYRADVTSTGAAIFHQTVVRLIADFVARPVIGAVRPLLLGDAQFGFRALVRMLESEDAEIFPDGVDAAVVAAFAAAATDLTEFFGSGDPADWRWGEMHVRTLKHPLGGEYDRGPVPSQGGFAVVNRSDISYLTESGPATLPYNIVDGPDMRFVVELEPGASTTRIMLPHGSSGNPASPHYDDQFADWVAGRYRTAHYLSADVDAAAVSTRTLR